MKTVPIYTTDDKKQWIRNPEAGQWRVDAKTSIPIVRVKHNIKSKYIPHIEEEKHRMREIQPT